MLRVKTGRTPRTSEAPEINIVTPGASSMPHRFTPRLGERKHDEKLTTIDYFLTLNQVLPPEKLLSEDAKPIYCRIYSGEELDTERLLRWEMHATRDIVEGEIRLSFDYYHNSLLENVRYVFGNYDGPEFKAFKTFKSESVKDYLQKLINALEENGIKATASTESRSPAGEVILDQEINEEKLNALAVKVLNHKSYFERLFDAMPDEFKSHFKITSSDQHAEILKVVEKCIIKSLQRRGIELNDIDEFDHMVTPYEVATSVFVYRNKQHATYVAFPDDLKINAGANAALKDLGMIMINPNDRYNHPRLFRRPRNIIGNIKQFYEFAKQLNLTASVSPAMFATSGSAKASIVATELKKEPTEEPKKESKEEQKKRF